MLNLSQSQTLHWISMAASFAVLLQTIELLQLRSYWSESGAWNSIDCSRDFQKISLPLGRTLQFLFTENIFILILLSSLVSSLSMFFFPHFLFVAVMLLATFLIALRWQGSFNGGSDNMTFLVLSTLLLASQMTAHPKWVSALLAYLAFQTGFSFFISGMVKFRSRNWRSGLVLKSILEGSIYPVPDILRKKRKAMILMRALSLFLILFELLFPLALFSYQIGRAHV